MYISEFTEVFITSYGTYHLIALPQVDLPAGVGAGGGVGSPVLHLLQIVLHLLYKFVKDYPFKCHQYCYSSKHIIIDDRIEKYDAYIIVFSKVDCCNEE